MIERESLRGDIGSPDSASEQESHWFNQPDVVPLSLSEEERARHVAREEEALVRAQARAETAAAVQDTDADKINPVSGRSKGKILIKNSNPRLERLGASTLAGGAVLGAWATKKVGYGLDYLFQRMSQWGTDLIKEGEKGGPKLPVFGHLFKWVTTPLDIITFGRLRGKPAKTFGEVAAEEEKKKLAEKKKEKSVKARVEALINLGYSRKDAERLVKGLSKVEEDEAEEKEKPTTSAPEKKE